jgi:hypothetical protein
MIAGLKELPRLTKKCNGPVNLMSIVTEWGMRHFNRELGRDVPRFLHATEPKEKPVNVVLVFFKAQ